MSPPIRIVAGLGMAYLAIPAPDFLLPLQSVLEAALSSHAVTLTETIRLADYNVLLLPGSYLARTAQGVNPGAGFVRIALVAPLADCVEAAERIRSFISRL